MTLTNKRQQKCATCGGNLIFNPTNQNLICEKCFGETALKVSGDVLTHKLSLVAKQHKNVENQENRIVKCPNCGSTVELGAHNISDDCEYCGSSLVAQQLNVKAENPDAIIPFAFAKKRASEIFADAVKKKFWAPKQFKQQLPDSKIEGDYLPSFSFNAVVTYSYHGRLYENITTRDADGNSTTERRYFNISGVGEGVYKDLLVEASSEISQDRLTSVLPFNYSEKKKYDDAFIAGYEVEKYDTSASDCVDKYKLLLNAAIRRDILSQYRYDGVSTLQINKNFCDESYSYYLVPVYKFSYKYKKKHYITYMNGQTGKVDNKVPVSSGKIALAIIIPLLIFALPFIVMFVQFLIAFFAGANHMG